VSAFRYFFSAVSKQFGPKHRIALLGFSFCLIMAFIAERYFGIADITGAYIAGVVISNTIYCDYVKNKMDTVSPFYFISYILCKHRDKYYHIN
jgi:Kef-type K+ transport system membrane component KefB